MIYVYNCEGCGGHFDIIKAADDFRRPEHCPTSGTTLNMVFTPTHLVGTKVQELKYQPALGRPATDRELAAEAKRRDWIEVGNEDTAKHLRVPQVEYPTFTDDDVAAISRNIQDSRL